LNNMKGRTILIALAAFIIVGVLAAALVSRGGAQGQRNSAQVDSGITSTIGGQVAVVNGGVQDVTLSLKNGYYVVTPSSVVAGVPVRMTVDLRTVTGCTKDVVIPSLGIRKRVSSGDNVISFTPLKTGTVQMSCSMGMATGSFEVVASEADSAVVSDATTNVQAVGSQGVAQAALLQAIVQPAAGKAMAGCGMMAGGAKQAGGCGCGG
jgi:uncharacterized protein